MQRLPIIQFIRKEWSLYRRVRKGLKWCHDDLDPKKREATTPPKSEIIEIHCTWVTEAYTPSNINMLLKSLKRLGWDSSQGNLGTATNLVEWVQQSRSLGGRRSWTGGSDIICSRNNSAAFLGATVRHAALPLGVEYGRLSIFTVTSSLTLVTIQFVFNETIAKSLNELFRASYRTKVKYRRTRLKFRGATFTGVVEQKRQAIGNRIDEIHESLNEWFGKNLPGHFCLSKSEALPIVDLITSIEYRQTEEGASRPIDYYIDLMFENSTEIWKNRDDDTIELRIPSHGEKPVASLFGNFSELTKDIDQFGGKDRDALTCKFQIVSAATISLWATYKLLLSYERQLASIRDKATLRIRSVGKALKNLDEIRHKYLSISADAQVIANDVATHVVAQWNHIENGIDFLPPHFYKTIYPTFLEMVRQQTKMSTEHLRILESRVNKAVTSNSDLASAIANLRLQRSVFWLTIIIACLTLFSILRIDLSNVLSQVSAYIVNLF